jgi:hypothetical protein
VAVGRGVSVSSVGVSLGRHLPQSVIRTAYHHYQEPTAKKGPSEAEAELIKRAAKSSEAALKMLQERDAELMEQEKQRKEEVAKWRREQERRLASMLAIRKLAEDDLQSVVEKVAKIREEAEKEKESGGKEQTSKAKERAKELKRLEQEEAAKRQELERLLAEEQREQQEAENELKRQQDRATLLEEEKQQTQVKLTEIAMRNLKLRTAEGSGDLAPISEDGSAPSFAALKPRPKGKSIRFQLDPEWSDGPLLRPGRSLIRLRRFKHLIFAPEDVKETRDCVLAIFTDICALCKPEGGGVLRLLFRPTSRAMVWAETVEGLDMDVILMHFAAMPPIYLRTTSPVEAQYWAFLLPKN